MYENADSTETLKTSMLVTQYISIYMEYGLDEGAATEMAMFDVQATMAIDAAGFHVDIIETMQ